MDGYLLRDHETRHLESPATWDLTLQVTFWLFHPLKLHLTRSLKTDPKRALHGRCEVKHVKRPLLWVV